MVRRVDGEQVAPERQKLPVGFHRLLELRPLFSRHSLQPVHREAVVQERGRSLVVVSDQVDVLGEELLLTPFLLIGRFAERDVNATDRPLGPQLGVSVVGGLQKGRVAKIDGSWLLGDLLGSGVRRRSLVTQSRCHGLIFSVM